MTRVEETAALWGYAIGSCLIVAGAFLAFGWKVGLIAAGAVVLWGCR